MISSTEFYLKWYIMYEILACLFVFYKKLKHMHYEYFLSVSLAKQTKLQVRVYLETWKSALALPKNDNVLY